MRSVLLALAFCTLMVVNGGVVKRSDDVTFQDLVTLVQQQAVAISTLQATVNSQHTALNSQQATIQSLQGDVTGLKNNLQTLSKSVAFTVRFLHDEDYFRGQPLTLHQTLKFDQVITNAGNGYNPTTGIFTSPLAGYYAFSIVAMIPDGTSHPPLALGIVKNGAVIDVMWVPNNQNIVDEQGSTHSVIHLAAGDQVWIRQDGYGDGVRGGTLTVFTGYLVHAD